MTITDIKKYVREQMQYIDRTYWVMFVGLILMASIALFSASSFFVFQEGNSTLGPILSQMVFIATGVVLVLPYLTLLMALLKMRWVILC
jgi:hypothetical protein